MTPLTSAFRVAACRHKDPLLLLLCVLVALAVATGCALPVLLGVAVWP